MKVVDLGGGAVALEPEDANESAANFDPKELRRMGWSKEVIAYFQGADDGTPVPGHPGRQTV